MSPTSLTRANILAGLKSLGLPPGAKVLVHSSLSSFGHVDGGADAVIDALLESVGTPGTILMPTLTGNETHSPANPPEFDPRVTPGWTGHIPETFRQRSQAVRSLHPTHSVAAIGLGATMLTAYHIASVTPCDELSPYGRLASLDDSYILLLGVSHEANTTLHHAEELVGVPYHIQPGFARSKLAVNGQTVERNYLLHAYGTARAFERMEPFYIERGIQRNGQIGQVTARLLKTREMVALTVQCLRADPHILCA